MKTLIVGLGSYQGADQIGWVLIDELKTAVNSQTTLIKSKSDGSDWYHEIKDNRQVIFLDALLSGDTSEIVIELSTEDLKNMPAENKNSTHSISLNDSITMAQNLGMLNVPVRIIGIPITPLGMSNIDIIKVKKYIVDLVTEKTKTSKKSKETTKNQ